MNMDIKDIQSIGQFVKGLETRVNELFRENTALKERVAALEAAAVVSAPVTSVAPKEAETIVAPKTTRRTASAETKED